METALLIAPLKGLHMVCIRISLDKVHLQCFDHFFVILLYLDELDPDPDEDGDDDDGDDEHDARKKGGGDDGDHKTGDDVGDDSCVGDYRDNEECGDSGSGEKESNGHSPGELRPPQIWKLLPNKKKQNFIAFHLWFALV